MSETLSCCIPDDAPHIGLTSGAKVLDSRRLSQTCLPRLCLAEFSPRRTPGRRLLSIPRDLCTPHAAEMTRIVRQSDDIPTVLWGKRGSGRVSWVVQSCGLLAARRLAREGTGLETAAARPCVFRNVRGAQKRKQKTLGGSKYLSVFGALLPKAREIPNPHLKSTKRRPAQTSSPARARFHSSI